MNEEIKKIDFKIKEYQGKIKELEDKKEALLGYVGKFFKCLSIDTKDYIYVSRARNTEGGLLDVVLSGLVLHKPFGGEYSIISDDCIYAHKSDLIELTKEEFEEALDKAVNNIKSTIK